MVVSGGVQRREAGAVRDGDWRTCLEGEAGEAECGHCHAAPCQEHRGSKIVETGLGSLSLGVRGHSWLEILENGIWLLLYLKEREGTQEAPRLCHFSVIAQIAGNT